MHFEPSFPITLKPILTFQCKLSLLYIHTRSYWMMDDDLLQPLNKHRHHHRSTCWAIQFLYTNAVLIFVYIYVEVYDKWSTVSE